VSGKQAILTQKLKCDLMKKQRVSWKRVQKAIGKIARWAKKHSFTEVYGLPRGGLVPAVMLSHALKIPLLGGNATMRGTTLVVDDIADTGKTLLKFTNKECKIATLFYKKHSITKPDFWVYEKKKAWIVFPWEV